MKARAFEQSLAFKRVFVFLLFVELNFVNTLFQTIIWSQRVSPIGTSFQSTAAEDNAELPGKFTLVKARAFERSLPFKRVIAFLLFRTQNFVNILLQTS